MANSALALVDDHDDVAIVAPDHLANLYSDNKIDFDKMVALSCEYYRSELNALQSMYDSSINAMSNKEIEILRLEKQINEFKVMEQSFALSRAMLSKLNENEPQSEALRRTNKLLLDSNLNYEAEIKALKPLESKLTDAMAAIDALKIDNSKLSQSLSEAEQALRIKNNSSLSTKAEYDLVLDKNARLEKQLAEIKEKLNQAYFVRDEIKQSYDSVLELRKADKIILDSSKATAETIVARMEQIEKEHTQVYNVNQTLSLYIESISQEPLWISPEGHELRVLLTDRSRITSASGKKSNIAYDKPVFYWHNPNGLGCIVALAAKENSDDENVLLFPSLMLPDLAHEKQFRMYAERLDAEVSPDKKYYDEIIKHIESVSCRNMKEEIVKAYARANMIVKDIDLNKFEGCELWPAWKDEFCNLSRHLVRSKAQKFRASAEIMKSKQAVSSSKKKKKK